MAAPPAAEDIRRAFGIDVGDLVGHEGGFEADAFTDGTWFLKLWRYEPDADAALALTGRLAQRGVPVPAAARAVDGTYTAEHDGRRYAMFPFVPGREATAGDAAAIGRAMRAVHELTDVVLPCTTMEEWCIEVLRDRLDHPWIADRRDEVAAQVDRLESVIERARAIDVPHVVCHHDLQGGNVLVDDAGVVVALVDWGHALLAPREHDLFICFAELLDPVTFLEAYGAEGLDLTHLEYALLARAVRDLAARVFNEVDRDGIEPWGFARWRRLDADLAQASRFS